MALPHLVTEIGRGGTDLIINDPTTVPSPISDFLIIDILRNPIKKSSLVL